MRFSALFVLLAALSGCNTARFGASYNQRLAGIETVALLPISVTVKSIHGGGEFENRPDLEDEVRRRFVTGLTSEIRERGRKLLLADRQTTEEKRIEDLALVSAVRDSILLCHYERSGGRLINYDLAETLRPYAPPGADAVLCLDVLGIVPTAGREALKVTVVAIGLLFGVHKHVSTNDAIVHLMLVDLDTGEVIWFHTLQDTPDVRSDRRVRGFVGKACKFLLEPIK